MRTFYTGPAINAETLVMMLEKHGIIAAQEWVDGQPEDVDELNRLATVLVPEADYERARLLFYGEKEGEL